MKKRLIAMAMAACMCFSLGNTTVLANNTVKLNDDAEGILEAGYQDDNIICLDGLRVCDDEEYTDEDLEHSAVFDTYTKKWGIDVSSYQGNEIDWNAVKGCGIDFAIIRLGGRAFRTAELTMDSYFSTNVKGAYEAGVEIGAYFYTNAITTEEAEEEAFYTVDALKEYKDIITLPVYIDIEASCKRLTAAELSKDSKTAICKTYCNIVQNAGYRVGVYSGASYLNSQLKMSELEKNYEVWMAHYTLKPTIYTRKYGMWQYSSNSKDLTTIVHKGIEGINKDPDLNVYYTKDYANVLCPESTKTVLEYSVTNPDGSPKTPAVAVTYNNTPLVENADYTIEYSNNVAEGDASVKITGIGSYSGSIVRSFRIGKKNLSKASAKLSETSFLADGTAKTPVPTVVYDDFTLVNGVDYTVEYSNNIEPGTATAKITGIGNYSGSISLDYSITQAIDNAIITLGTTIYSYDGAAKKPDVTVNFNGQVLSNKTDYTVTYSNNKALGNGLVTIVGKGKYSGSKTASFAIISYDAGISTTYKQAYVYKDIVYGISNPTVDTATVACSANTTIASASIPATISVNNLTYRVTAIKKKAFNKNTSLKKVTIGKNVAKIGDSAFYGCSMLTSVKYGSKVESLGTSAFKNCTSLKSVTLPASVSSIGKNAFMGCKKLKTITIKNSNKINVKTNAFKGIYSYATFKVSSSLVKQYKSYFSSKKGYKKTMKIQKK